MRDARNIALCFRNMSTALLLLDVYRSPNLDKHVRGDAALQLLPLEPHGRTFHSNDILISTSNLC